MGLLTGILTARQATAPETVSPVFAAGEVDPFQAPVAVPSADAAGPWWSKDTERAVGRITIDLARQIGAVRKAEHLIAGTISTWALGVWQDDDRLTDSHPYAAWLGQPAARRTRQWIITRTVQDLIWHDRSVWRVTDRTVLGAPTAVERLHPDRIDTITHPRDPDTVDAWIIDGHETAPSKLIVFDGAGIGGIRRFGYDLLTMYGDLQAAAGRYARAPHPHAILKNHGEDLNNDEISALLASWQAARETSSVGYLNDVLEYETHGYNAKELQLTEARAAAATDVARMFGLPAVALDATSGDSMTYANIVDRRRDLVEALRPWSACIESTLSLDDRTTPGRPRGLVIPHGYTVRFDTADYLRESPTERAATYAALIGAGVLTVEEARAIEPLVRTT